MVRMGGGARGVGQHGACTARIRREEWRNSRESGRFKGRLRVPAPCLLELAGLVAKRNTPAWHLRSNSLLGAARLYQVSRNETTASLMRTCRNARI